MKKNCIVLGSGRSGTSSVMGLLSDSGYYMGERLYVGRPSNPKGFFESGIINQANETILSYALPKRFFFREERLFKNFYWNENLPRLSFRQHIPVNGQRWLAALPLKTPLYANRAIEKTIKNLVKKKPFCFKDPRFSYTLPIWRKYWDETNIVYIVIFRHPNSTIKSILKEVSTAKYLKGKLRFTEEDAIKYWLQMYKHILVHHHKKSINNWLFIHYEQLLDGFAFTKLRNHTKVASLKEDFIEKRYYRSKPEKNINNQAILELYTKLCQLADYPNEN